MDFYEQQASKRWHSMVLLVAFLVVLATLGVLIHVVITSLSLFLGQGGSYAHPSKPAIAMIWLVWITMIAGGVFRLMDVRAGGAVLARRFGAVNASDRSRHDKEKQLLNVVAEVAIASSTPQPDVYVLRREDSINAFVLGNRQSRPVIVVTEGALETFDRAQLQAVVAHEFGHIVNGDLPLNMRLLIAMGALMAVDEVGRLLMPKGDSTFVHPGAIIGFLVCSLGKVGVIAGQLISSAFSRQREYLADASGVQFTRNPFALASALDTIRQHDHQPALHGVHACELLYLCFQNNKADRWWGSMMSTHPAISRRIHAIDEHFHLKNRKVKLREVVNTTTIDLALPTTQFSGIQLVNSDAGVANFEGPQTSMEAMVVSDRIILMLSGESTCVAALFAMFIRQNGDQEGDYFNALTLSSRKKFSDEVKDVLQKLPDELINDQLGIIAHVSHVLTKRLSESQRHKIMQKLEKMLKVNNDYHLMDYARVQLIRRKLQVDFPTISAIADGRRTSAKGSKARNFDSMGSEFALLLSLMVESSGASPKELDEQFQRVLKCYTLDSYPRRTTKETGIIKELEDAFQTLYIQPQPIRHAFVHHCIEIMKHDGFVMPNERALLDLFAASLDCEELIAA